ncbi:hypothetical protein [Demequina iriomotensis]|uniref:hypothetical protein n=1 Tax=Demequina iriomotensis TaxID=1536641 RepID=UPI00078251FF|nr:hypothetical protein [Demequina iriomotensis]
MDAKELTERRMIAATTTTVSGVLIDGRPGSSGWIIIAPCVCVQDTPENPCPCNWGTTIWIREDAVISRDRSGRRSPTSGDEIVDLKVDRSAQVVVESTRTVPVADAVVYNVPSFWGPLPPGSGAGWAGLAFAAGYSVGTIVDDATGLSDKIADALWDLFGKD